MNFTQLHNRLRNIEQSPKAHSQVIIVYNSYKHEAADLDGLASKIVPIVPDRVTVVLSPSQRFTIDREGQSLKVIAEKVEKIYPFGTKYLFATDHPCPWVSIEEMKIPTFETE